MPFQDGGCKHIQLCGWMRLPAAKFRSNTSFRLRNGVDPTEPGAIVVKTYDECTRVEIQNTLHTIFWSLVDGGTVMERRGDFDWPSALTLQHDVKVRSCQSQR
jgi:hypothetical protein